MPRPNESVSTAAGVRTFLIADVRGYTRFTQEHGDEAAARLAAKFATLAREGVTARGGEVVELRGDEALAAFGSARQALHAAVELQDLFAQASAAEPGLPLAVGIGLDAGEAVRLEGGYRGGALNLAARLCSLAGPGEVLASEGVIHLTRKTEGLAYAERGQVELKGFADPVRIVQILPLQEGRAERRTGDDAALQEMDVIEPSTRTLPIGTFLGAVPQGPLVARNEELGRVLTAVTEVMRGAGRLVLLAGEPGAGKTRLAQEVMLHVRNREFLIGTGSCYEPQQGVPFHPFLEVLGALYGATGRAVQAEIPHRWPRLTPLLPDQPASPRVIRSDAQGEQQELYRAVTAFLESLAQMAPVALLLDDLHWADSSSLELLQHLARHTRGHRVLLLGTYRDIEVGRQHPLEAALLNLIRQRLVERVDVRRFGQEGTAALMATTLGTDSVSGEFAELVHGRTEGNPFFVEEVVRALVERGDVYRDGGQWTRRAIEDLVVPESVRAVIGQRLARLSEGAQGLLQQGSVLGQTFTFDALQEMGGRPEEEVEAALEEAVAAGLLEETGRDSYTFNHSLTRQALYAELSSRRRRKLHRAAGEALERLQVEKGEVSQPRAAELAWHFLEAGEEERALPFAMLAGDRAEAVFAHVEAFGHYSTALELARELDDRAQELAALDRLGQIGMVLNRHGEAEGAYSQMLEAARAAGDGNAEGRALFWLSFIRTRLSRVEEARSTAEAALQVADQVGDDRLRAASRWNLGHVQLVFGEGDLGRRYMEEAQRLARGTGDHLVVGRTLRYLAQLEIWGGHYARAEALATEAVSLARQSHDPIYLGGACWPLGLARGEMGHYSRALEALEEGLRCAEESGDVHYPVRLLNTLGWLHGEIGDLDTALGLNVRALDMARNTNRERGLGSMREIESYSLLNLATDKIQADDIDGAERLLQELEQTSGQAAYARFRWHNRYQLARAQLALARGDAKAAVHFAAEAEELARAKGVRKNVVKSWMLWGQALLGLRQATEARARLQQALSLADDIAHGSLRWQTRLHLAQAHLAEHKPTAAASLLREATGLIAALSSGLEDERLRGCFGSSPRVREAHYLAAAMEDRATRPTYPAGLSEREVEVLRLVAQGATNAGIAEALTISVKTVNSHITNILNKTDCANRAAAAAFALRHGIG